MANIQERVATLASTIETEQAKLHGLEETKLAAQTEIEEMESRLVELQEELKNLNETLEEKNKIVDDVKRRTMRAAKVLDQALKDISIKVRSAS